MSREFHEQFPNGIKLTTNPHIMSSIKCEATTHHKATNYHSAFDAVCGGEMEEKGEIVTTKKTTLQEETVGTTITGLVRIEQLP